MGHRWICVGNNFVPTDISGLTGWYKADGANFQDSARTTAATADADPVGSFTDYSGGNRHFLQGTAGSRPLLKLNIKNGKPVLRFDGTDDKLTCATTLTNFIAASAHTTFVVYKCNSNTSGLATVYQNPGLFVDGTGGYWGMYVTGTTAGTTKSALYNWDGNADKAETSTDFTNFWVTMGRHEAGNLYSSVNAGSETSAASGDTASLTGTMFIGVDRLGTTYWFNGDIAEIVNYNVALTASQITSVYTYLKNKYGI